MSKKLWIGILIAVLLIFGSGIGIYFYLRELNTERQIGKCTSSEYDCLWEMALRSFKENDYLQTIKCIRKIENFYPNEHEFLSKCPDNIACLQLISKSFQELKQYDMAEKYFKQLLEATINTYRENHFSVATAYYGLGYLFLDKQQPDEACLSFMQALRVFENNPPEDSFYVAKIFWGLAQSCEQKENYRDAIFYAKKSLAVTSKKPITEQQQKLNVAIEKWERLLIAPQ